MIEKGITMDLRRAYENEAQNFKYDRSIERNTALIAVHNDEIIGTLEYDFIGLEAAEVTHFKVLNDSKKIMNGLIKEFNYWHPFIKRLYFNELIESHIKPQNNIIHFKDACLLYKVDIADIVPEQLTVSKAKFDRVDKWIESSEDVVVGTVEIDDKIVCVDGYSRLVSAYLKGLESVYIYKDIVEDKSLYEVCLSWCKAEGIYTIEDLSKRIVSAEEHQRVWIDRCQENLNG
ncbi:MAG: hypothetical protein JEZ08_04190 [Clostridiales bacterium]|nr:hypothetical protein [Clostridiales bacterium]